ncbi:MAG: PhzF family phenazine biosynthesis protein [Planctomycetota bacterium]|nr:PhzF family phenazine biosynthesis protein [Planctomycetota bacterium]
MFMKLYQVDAFAKTLFRGNPAAVCVLTEAKDDSWMQSLAQEMNLSETAFLRAREDGYSLRWFTPTREVELCGHATLASSHVLFTEGFAPLASQLRFHTKSGILTAAWSEGQLVLDFPAMNPSSATPSKNILRALGVEEVVDYQEARHHTVIRLRDVQAVKALTPDFLALKECSSGLVIATAKGEGDYDFVSRVFATYAGIPEDPVTGAAHCCLAPYWDRVLEKNGALMEAFQASRRGGALTLALSQDRVSLRGFARTVLRGELLLDS